MTIPIILAGGMGTRLQPLSTPDNPKQFLTLFNGLSLFQITIKRIRQWLPAQPLLLLCQAAHKTLAQEQLQQVDPTGQHIFILEPSVRNTAASIASASHYCQQHFPKETLVFIPSDQYVLNPQQWLIDMQEITEHIDPTLLTLLGVAPSSAHSGFGYIQKGHALNYGFDVQNYVEKPKPALAEKFFNNPSYYWSCGTFLGLAKTFLEAYTQSNPTLSKQCQQALHLSKQDLLTSEHFLSASSLPQKRGPSKTTKQPGSPPSRGRRNSEVVLACNNTKHQGQQIFLDKVSYEKCLAKSFDYEIVENYRPLAVAELSSGWLDIGTHEGLNEAFEHLQNSLKKT